MFFILVFVGCVALAYVLRRLAFLVLIPMLLIPAALLCKWSVFVPACAVERLGPIKSLNRSSDLTKGCRFKIAGLYLLCIVIGIVVVLVFAFVEAFVSKFNPIFLAAFQQLALAVPMAFSNVITAVIYFELRNIKEGIAVDSLANVFD